MNIDERITAALQHDAPHALIHWRSGTQDTGPSYLRGCGGQELANPRIHDPALTPRHLVAGVRDQFGLHVGKDLASPRHRRDRIHDDLPIANEQQRRHAHGAQPVFGEQHGQHPQRLDGQLEVLQPEIRELADRTDLGPDDADPVHEPVHGEA